jgi:hypothetical protein
VGASIARVRRAPASKRVDGRIVVERIHRKLADLAFCRKGEPSELATARYQDILRNLDAVLEPQPSNE